MGVFAAYGHFWLQRLMAWEKLIDDARIKVNSGVVYTVDDAFNDVLRVCFADWEGWMRLFPGGKPPILFGMTNVGTLLWDDSVVVGYFQPTSAASLKASAFIQLKGAGTATVAVTHIANEQKIKFSLTGMATLASGDAYMVVAYDDLGGGKI